MLFCSHFRIILWKNILVRKRDSFRSILTICFPLVVGLALLLIQLGQTSNEWKDPTIFVWKDVDMASIGRKMGTVLFSPNSSLVKDIMSVVSQFGGFTVLGFVNTSQLESYYKFHPDNITMAVEFDLDYKAVYLPYNVSVYLRPSRSGRKWHTKLNYIPFEQTMPRNSSDDPDYFESGFLFVQYLVCKSVMATWKIINLDIFTKYPLLLQQMPFPPYKETHLKDLNNYFSLLLVLFPLLWMTVITKDLVVEKETKLKETMKLMGLSTVAYWLAWFFCSFVWMIFSVICFLPFCCVALSGGGAILEKTNPTIFFAFLICHGISVIAFASMMSVFIQTGKFAGYICPFVFLASYLPYQFLATHFNKMTRLEKLVASLLFNTGLGLGSVNILKFEGMGIGAQWRNLMSAPVDEDNFSLLDGMVMMLIDSGICFIIAWYVSNISPGEFGLPQPWYFPFTPYYWCGTRPKKRVTAKNVTRDEVHFENDPSELSVGIEIIKLTKEFKLGQSKITAVNNINLKVYEGQITALLGYNDAGKTTLTSILTGSLLPTFGKVKVNGHNISSRPKVIHRSLGLCPHHNIVFDNLTVLENLEFFALLKGLPNKKAKKEANVMVTEMGLDADILAKTLSGCQKRRLSLGIAFVGGSKIVILDEPTAGMDLTSRNSVWNTLKRYKDDRTILLTTHLMDEAEVLGDRIAIMAHGVVKCCGTSMFLKKVYGAGYHLVLEKDRGCMESSVTRTVKNIIHSAQLESEVNTRLTYLLPDDKLGHFAHLYSTIEENKRSLGIISYYATTTTMEEVFLNVGREADVHPETTNLDNEPDVTQETVARGADVTVKHHHIPSISLTDVHLRTTSLDTEPDVTHETDVTQNAISPVSDSDVTQLTVEIPGEMDVTQNAISSTSKTDSFLALNKISTNSGPSLHLTQFKALFIKKVIYSTRNILMSLFQCILPVVLTALLLFTEIKVSDDDDVPLKLDLSPYGETITPCTDGIIVHMHATGLYYKYRQIFSKPHSLDRMDRTVYLNVSDYFLMMTNKLTLYEFNRRVIIGGQFEAKPFGVACVGHYNGQVLHSPPIALGYVINTFVSIVISKKFAVIPYLHPLPRVGKETKQTFVNEYVTSFTASYLLAFTMSMLTCSFAYFLTDERRTGAKHLQKMSGVSPFVFWMSNYVWDYIIYLIPCLGIVILFCVLPLNVLEPYIEDGHIVLVLLVYMAYGFAALPCVYMLQFLFKSPVLAVSVLMMLSVVTGMIPMIILLMLKDSVNTSKAVQDFCGGLIPHYSFFTAMHNIYLNHKHAELCNKMNYTEVCRNQVMPCCKGNCGDFCVSFDENYLTMDGVGIGKPLLMMILQGFVFFGFTVIIENKHTGSEKKPRVDPTISHEDYDVHAERSRIEQLSQDDLKNSNSLILVNLFKRFGDYDVVNHLSIEIPEKECFGLLGQNGAGKSTTLKMLSGAMPVSDGNAYLKTYDLCKNIKQMHQHMGYCPQLNGFIDQMTGRETLYMHARLKGVPASEIQNYVKSLMNVLGLAHHADKRISANSCSIRRKLSVAVSLVGNPSFILLDEPSRGMDHQSRRDLWKVLSRLRESGKALLLTSQCMEECTAVCTRLSIMVNGRLKCLGTPQYLENKFAQGYTVIMKIAALPNGENPSVKALCQYLKHCFDACVHDGYQGYLYFQLSDPSVKLSYVFKTMKKAKTEYNIAEYSVRQTTLEQMFLSLSKEQIEP